MSMIDDYKKKVDEAHKAVYGAAERTEILNEYAGKIIYSDDDYSIYVEDETSFGGKEGQNNVHFKIYNKHNQYKSNEISRLNPFNGEIIMSHSNKAEKGVPKTNVVYLAKEFINYKDKESNKGDFKGLTVIDALAATMNLVYNRKDITPDMFCNFSSDLHEGSIHDKSKKDKDKKKGNKKK